MAPDVTAPIPVVTLRYGWVVTLICYHGQLLTLLPDVDWLIPVVFGCGDLIAITVVIYFAVVYYSIWMGCGYMTFTRCLCWIYRLLGSVTLHTHHTVVVFPDLRCPVCCYIQQVGTHRGLRYGAATLCVYVTLRCVAI